MLIIKIIKWYLSVINFYFFNLYNIQINQLKKNNMFY